MNHDFRIGEKAVYPAHGVAEVIGIEKKEINTTVCSFYVLKVLATGGLAQLFVEDSEHIEEVHEDLTLEGLKIIYDRNRTAKRSRAR